MSLQKLIYLCHVKNELNRRRRRFYYYQSPTSWYAKHTKFGTAGQPYTKEQAIAGYEKAKKDMKALTSEMRALRMSLDNVRIFWGSCGQITAVHRGSQRIHADEFKKYYNDEIFERDVL